tara:strand:+ start:107 stop:469 length:363 start_codon:yes stop_codon:yes gene_type:complete
MVQLYYDADNLSRLRDFLGYCFYFWDLSLERQGIFMTDDEFEVLDELYFVQTFHELIELTGKEAEELKRILSVLYDKGWIRVFKEVDEEIPVEETDWIRHAERYIFLASKEGLMAHNTAD